MPRTAIIAAWTCLLLVVVYMMFVVRYYYRVPDADDPVTIVQCTAATFTASLLRERMPVVCRGVGDLAGFQALATSARTGAVDSSVGDPLYTSLRVPGWFCRRAPAIVRTKPPSPTPPAQSLADVALDVQLVGTRRVALWVPKASCEDAHAPLRRVDVVLSQGDGLFVPFQWWVAESDAAGGGSGGGETGGPSRWCALRWENVVAGALGTHGWLGACRRWESLGKIGESKKSF